MADKKQNRRNNRNNQDDDFNPKFRKMRKKYWEIKYRPMKKEQAKENLQKAHLA